MLSIEGIIRAQEERWRIWWSETLRREFADFLADRKPVTDPSEDVLLWWPT